MQFSKTKLSVLNPMNSLQSNHAYNGVQNVHHQCSYTLAIVYATDDYAVLISEKCMDLSIGAGYIMTSVGPPQPHPSPSSYVPHSHVMPPQVPTMPAAQPPPSHLLFIVPISSLSQTDMTYLHVPQTHTVLADVHTPFTRVSIRLHRCICCVYAATDHYIHYTVTVYHGCRSHTAPSS